MAKTRKLLLTSVLVIVCLVASLCAVLLPNATPAQAMMPIYEYAQSSVGFKPAANTESKVAIVFQASSKYYAISVSGTTVTRIEVTVADGKLTNATSDMLFTLKTDNSGNFNLITSDGKYLDGSSGLKVGTTVKKFYTNYNGTYLIEYDGDKYIQATASSFNSYTNENYATTFLVFAATPSGKVIDYEKSALAVGDTKEGMLVANVDGVAYAFTMFNAATTSPNKAYYVALCGNYLDEINTNTSDSPRNMTSEIANWHTWTVTRTANGVKMQTNSTYSSASGRCLRMTAATSFSVDYSTNNQTNFIMVETDGGFYLKNESQNSYIKFNTSNTSNLQFTGVAVNASKTEEQAQAEAAVFNFYEKKENTAPATVDVTFEKGNDSASGTMAAKAVRQSAYRLPSCSYTLSGHSFAGWKVGDSETVMQADELLTNVPDNLVLTATWKSNACTLIFKMTAADGSELTSEGVAANITSTYNFSKNNEDLIAQGSTPAGKMFSHWTTDGTDEWKGYLKPTGDMTLTAVFVDAVNVVFDWNKGNAPVNSYNVKNKTLVKGSEFTLPSLALSQEYLPTREGFTLAGWRVNGVTYKTTEKLVINEDTTIFAVWNKSQYTITLSVNGSNTTKTVANGESFTPSGLYGSSKPFKKDMVFAGWLDEEGQLVDETTPIVPEDDMTFTASFREPETYTFTFHWGELTATKDYTEGASATVPTALFGTLFVDEIGERDIQCTGWYEDSALTTLFTVSSFTVSSAHANKHLYASVSERYEVVFNWNYVVAGADEANTTSRKAVVGTPIAVPYHNEGIVTRENYRLVGWAEAPDGEIIINAEQSVTVNTPCTLYAVWDYDYYVITVKVAGNDTPVGTVEVAKNRNGNTSVKINELKDAEDVLVINWTAVKVEGKDATWTVIKGEDDEGRDTALNEQITLTSDITLQVRFTDHLYTITVNWIGGKLAEIKQAGNTDVTAPETDKAGYRFVAFYLNNEQGAEYTFDKMPTEDIVVWCKYEILDSTLKFNTGEGGTEIADITQKTGTQVDKPANPTREGYEFKGWLINGQPVSWLVKEGTGTTTNPEYYINMPGGETTIVAKWELTAEGLATLKTAKIAELEAYVAEKGVDLPESYTNAINNATTEAGVNEALTAAKAKVDELKAEKDAAAALTAAKTEAKQAVAAAATEGGVTAPSTAAIDAATTIEAVNTAKAAALAEVATAVAEKKAAAELAKAKTDAKAELAAYATAKEVTAPASLAEAIDNATTKEAVTAALAAGKAEIDRLAAPQTPVEDAKVTAAKNAIAAAVGASGVKDALEKIATANAAIAELTAEQKAQLDLTAFNEKVTGINNKVNGAKADLEGARKIANGLVLSAAATVALLTAAVWIAKRRMF